MKTKIVIIFLSLILVFFIFLFYFISQKNSNTQNINEKSQKVKIGKVQVQSFLPNFNQLNPDKAITLMQNPQYSIIYQPGLQRFIIKITSSPFGQTRLTAESNLLNTLKINQTSACELKVDEIDLTATKPNFVGLSFCP